LVGEIRRRVNVPLIAMVRPRAGGFCYSDADSDVMARDAGALLHAGAEGLAFGVLTAESQIDLGRCRHLRDVCGDRAAVFHRAFDVTAEPIATLDRLIELGFTRVMTSGRKVSAQQGAGLIAEVVSRAAGRIEIMPAAGINASNVCELVAQTGCNQVHASARTIARDASAVSGSRLRFGFSGSLPDSDYERTDPVAVRALRTAIDGLSGRC
jgi:copper homeostasis protein